MATLATSATTLSTSSGVGRFAARGICELAVYRPLLESVAEQQPRARLVQRCEPNLVDHVVPQQAIDDAADGVVGQSSVELLD